ncbi:PolC-type DNA polymerase III [Spiroplasma endosymbiont of Aspidapion aeneum]|uniref:PolC-type DNA polymerase III n=1 Tax=Spiroplasma endosymbiont of Aspidapion aeneum TaxID=3066276 RepID=UPI00313A7AFD
MDDYIKKIIEASNNSFQDSELALLSKLRIDSDNIVYDKVKSIARIKVLANIFLPTSILKKLEPGFENTHISAIYIIKAHLTDEIFFDYLEHIHYTRVRQNNDGFLSVLFKKQYIRLDLDNNNIDFIIPDENLRQKAKENIDYLKIRLQKYGLGYFNTKIIVDESILNIAKKEIDDSIVKLETKPIINSTPKKENKKIWSQSSKVNLDEKTFNTLLEIEKNSRKIVVHGELIKIIITVTSSGLKIYKLHIFDGYSTIIAKLFEPKNSNSLNFFNKYDENNTLHIKYKEEFIKIGDWISILGDYLYSDFEKEYEFSITKYKKIKVSNVKILDDAKVKRVELHTHTNMSTYDGISTPLDYLKYIKELGMKAIAFTDHLNVQNFPNIFLAQKEINKGLNDEEKIKVIYGCELNIIDEKYNIVEKQFTKKITEVDFVVFDLETTGLSPELNEIIEFGAVKYNSKSGKNEKIDILIKPRKPVSSYITNLTHITNDLLNDKKSIEEEMPRILEFIGDAVLVAHNASFDMGFLNSWLKKLGYDIMPNTVIDTLPLARCLWPKLKSHRLGVVARKYSVNYNEEDAHRADYDAEVLKDIFENMINYARLNFDIHNIDDINKLIKQFKKNKDKNIIINRGFHLNVLVKNSQGIKDLYKIVSHSHTDGYLGSPKITWKKLEEINKNKNLLIGSGCADGEVFNLGLFNTSEKLEKEIKKYDYIELQPLSSYKYLIEKNIVSEGDLLLLIKKIIKLAKENNILLVASSDAHYIDKSLKSAKEIFIYAKWLKGARHPLFDFSNRIKTFPNQHLRTTNEMLEEFSFLEDEKLIEEIVITNTNKIASLINKDIIPIKTDMYPPVMDNSDNNLRDECYKNAIKTYGQKLPTIVSERLEKEINSIINCKYGVIYWVSSLLVKKANDDGWVVGSRGSVGSSVTATFSKITEVNPLPPHYLCQKCQFSDFDAGKDYKSGFDMPTISCPKCKSKLIGNGHNIPFETFLGFDGDKIPDIDLNFPSVYQEQAHNYCKEIFGENNCFRAGTISTVADKTAFGLVKEYQENVGSDVNITKAEIERLSMKITGVKKTTSKHAGGIIILPNGYEIEDFTPVNFPADDIDSDWKTTHFDFHSIHDNLLKLDLLGHDDPVMIRKLFELTGVDPLQIPMNDENVYSLFINLKKLNIDLSDLDETTGAIALPEFGTRFVRGVLKETQPKNFSDLVQISGLTHGTDVYNGNAQTLIKEKKATLSTVIGCRDDIMVYLIEKGLDKKLSFSIMESVRKGNGLKPEWINEMKKANVPDWYIESCLKIKYLFPKGHATAYVIMSYRIAWFKLYYPEEFYTAWLTLRTDKFDIHAFLNDKSYSLKKINEITSMQYKLTDGDKQIAFYEVIYEMLSRGIIFKNIDFNISQAADFKIVINENTQAKEIYLPFVVIDSLGPTVAQSIITARDESEITSIQDLENRTIINKTHLKKFTELGITSSLKPSNQLTFEL